MQIKHSNIRHKSFQLIYQVSSPAALGTWNRQTITL